MQRPTVGGHAWVFAQLAAGLRARGWDVVVVDRVDEWDPDRHPHIVNLLGGPQAVLDLGDLAGSRGDLASQPPDLLARGCELLVNVMGFLDDADMPAHVATRVFLDIDPGFCQMWKALGLADIFAGHDAFLTVGTTLDSSTVPPCGIDWIPMLPPVFLPDWPVSPPAPQAPITSVVSWRGPFGPIEYEGVTYGLRCHEFRKFFALPQRTSKQFELALDIDPADEKDRKALLDHGWGLVNPCAVAGTPDAYRDYISRSKAEFMVAKNLYVATRGGWFSDRSACYLATGRPVIAQDTGFSKVLPTGDGLLTFTTLDEAEAAVEDLDARYAEHCDAARWLAEEYFSSDVVLPKLLDAVL